VCVSWTIKCWTNSVSLRTGDVMVDWGVLKYMVAVLKFFFEETYFNTHTLNKMFTRSRLPENHLIGRQ